MQTEQIYDGTAVAFTRDLLAVWRSTTLYTDPAETSKEARLEALAAEFSRGDLPVRCKELGNALVARAFTTILH